MIKKILITTNLFILLSLPMGVANVSAAGIFGGVCDRPETKTSAACLSKSNKDPISGNNGIVSKIATIVALMAGAIAVIVIILGGIRFITANGDAGAIKTGKSMIVGALIGLAVIVLARTIVYFVVSKV